MSKNIPIVILLFLISCAKAPEFPSTPKITFNDIIFKDLSGEADSLIIYIGFEDGDGDLGLSPSEINPPYNQKNYFSNKTGKPFNFNFETLEDLLVYSNKDLIDSLPDYAGDAICFNWDTNPDLYLQDGIQLDDTVYFQFNTRHHNFLVDFYVNNGAGFETFDWRKEIGCSTTFDGRFPVLSAKGDEKSLEGTIKYGMTSSGFRPIFQEKLLKLRITIIDRAGNFSNTIETPEFKLSDID